MVSVRLIRENMYHKCLIICISEIILVYATDNSSSNFAFLKIASVYAKGRASRFFWYSFLTKNGKFKEANHSFSISKVLEGMF